MNVTVTNSSGDPRTIEIEEKLRITFDVPQVSIKIENQLVLKDGWIELEMDEETGKISAMTIVKGNPFGLDALSAIQDHPRINENHSKE